MKYKCEDEFIKLLDYQKIRFKGVRFSPSVFKTIEDLETKILTSDPVIIVYDEFDSSTHLTEGKISRDFYIVKRIEGQKHIYYKDVIDVLIENNFIRDDARFKFLEKIKEEYTEKRNDNSIKVFGLGWGS